MVQNLRFPDAFRKAVALLASITLACALFPAVARADAQEGTVDCGNGWVLSYSAEDGSATITGVSTAGKATLQVPASVGSGVKVTAVGARAFSGASQLHGISLPDSVASFGDGAFLGSQLESITLPKSLTAIPANCFRNCASLASVEFTQDTFRYIDTYAFAGCASLKEMTLPPLTEIVPSNPNTGKIGAWCFSGCSKLEKFTFLSGGKNDASNYFVNASCLQDCTSLSTFVFYCKKAVIPSGVTSGSNIIAMPQPDHTYYTVDFYGSEADAKVGANRVARVTYPSTVTLKSICKGTVDASQAYAGSDAIPQAPAGKVWGISDNGVTRDSSLLSDTYKAVAVDADDLNYAWMTSPEIEAYADDGTVGLTNWVPVREARYYMNEDGVSANIDDIKVYGPDFEPVDPSKYAVRYEYRNFVPNQASYSTYSDISGVVKAGMYRLTATGTGSYAGVKLPSVDIYVDESYAPDITMLTSSQPTENAGNLLAAAAAGNESSPSFVVVAPASDWRYGLVGSGLAGVGEGYVVYTDNGSTSAAAYRAIVDSKTDAVNVLGTTALVSKEVEAHIKSLSNMQEGGSIDRFDASTPQALAIDVYNTIKKYGSTYGYAWGSSAIVASPLDGASAVLAAQLAHEAKAPVFFTEDNGSISSKTLSALSGGSFTSIYIIGDSASVSASVSSKIASACSVTPQRLFDEGSVQLSSEKAIATMTGSYGNTPASFVVAAADDPVNVLAACEYAAFTDGLVYVCAGSADTNSALAYISKTGKRAIEKFACVGDYSTVNASFGAQLDKFWSDGSVPTTGKGDSFEHLGLRYTIESGSAASLNGVLGSNWRSSLSIGTAKHDGTTYKVTSVKGTPFANARATEVVFGTSVSSLPAKVFAGNSKVKTVQVKSTSLKSIGASAFKDCKALTSVKIASTKLKSIGANAFTNCSKLKTIVLKTKLLKASKVGKKSFSGIAKKATIKVPKAKVKAYKKMFKAKGLPSTAKVVKG